MSAALSLTNPMPTAAAETLEAVLNTTRELVETVNTTLDGLDGKAKNDVAGALANLLNAVAKRIEG